MMTPQKGNLFVFYRVSAACTPMEPEKIAALARESGVPEAIVPEYAGDRQQVSRAIIQVQGACKKKGLELKAAKALRHDVRYAIVEIQTNGNGQELGFTTHGYIEWSDAHGRGAHITGKHPIAQEVEEVYQSIRGMICPGDWTVTLRDYLTTTCQAFQFREDGRVYVAPAKAEPLLRQLAQFLAKVGISLILCEVPEESLPDTQQAAHEALYGQLQDLNSAIDSFDGMQKPTNYRRRMDELAALRARADTYKELFGIDIDGALMTIANLEKIVGNLLDTREQSVVHRDGSVSTQRTPGGGSIDQLARALEAHRLRFERLDDAPIVKAIDQLEELLKTHGGQYIPSRPKEEIPTKTTKHQHAKAQRSQRKAKKRVARQRARAVIQNYTSTQEGAHD